MSYVRKTFLAATATTLVGLAGLANCKDLGAVSQTVTNHSAKTYEKYDDLVDLNVQFMERTKAGYLANEAGAVATYYAPNGAEIRIIDGHPQGLDQDHEARLALASWFTGNKMKYDGIPDGVMITDSGVISRYDHATGISLLTTTSEDLKRITTEVGKYFEIFSAAVANGDVVYDDPKTYGDKSIVAALGRTKITARADSGNYQTNFFQVYRDGAIIIGITDCPDLFSESMGGLVAKANIELSKKILERLDR